MVTRPSRGAVSAPSVSLGDAFSGRAAVEAGGLRGAAIVADGDVRSAEGRGDEAEVLVGVVPTDGVGAPPILPFPLSSGRSTR
ncbi:hypothetical protein EKD16_13725 [Streptomonospora litoralis]|uniref:Uncharacterized protein n=1 Tax=Streptomonospora litoralis TaxID=2498135 RepID=A0A4P6Q6U1_9ACTN|nr:hypothetical protein EKD16_13725 [Streptomonospora litoralis]